MNGLIRGSGGEIVKTTQLFDLDGRTVIITGGSGYLGTVMSEIVAELGGNLILMSRNMNKNRRLADKLTTQFGNKIRVIEANIGQSESIDKAMKLIIEEFGKVDVLVNNAYYGSGGELLSMSQEDWVKGIDGSINGVFRMTQRVLGNMVENKYGRIINIASMYGVVAPNVSVYEDNEFYNPANYGAGKAAIIQFTKYIASVYGKAGVTCNSISPGPFPSRKVQENKAFIKKLEEKVPLGRIGKPEELKGLIALLASDASSYINGANIPIDGGWTAW